MASEGKNLIGVDIGSSSIKVCEIKEGRRGARTITRFGFHPLPAETIVDGHIINSSAVVEGLEMLFAKSKRRNVALRASGHGVIIKKIAMPLMTAAELQEQINWEAEQHIPFDLEEVHVDYEVLHERSDHGQMDVLLVAAKKEEITDLTNLAMEARLRPMVVDLDAFTVQNVFETGYGAAASDETSVLVHCGAATTTVNILADGTTAFTRDIANGGNAITEEIQRRYGLSVEEAGMAKRQGGLPDNYVPEVLEPFKEAMAQQVNRSIQFFYSASAFNTVDLVVLAGGSASVAGIDDLLQERLGVETMIANPFANMAVASKVKPQVLSNDAPALMIACGLALRSFD